MQVQSPFAFNCIDIFFAVKRLALFLPEPWQVHYFFWLSYIPRINMDLL